MKRLVLLLLLLVSISFSQAKAEINLDGFLQGLYGGRLDENNPTASEFTASETRMQLRAQHFGDNGQFFGRLDFTYDGAESESQYDWELREGYFKFRMGSKFDIKVGRQILTWGTGDLIFINDVFAKDYRSFFIGRDDQYLKAPQNALRVEYYSPIGALALVWSPDFEPNRLPNGERLSFYNPMMGDIIGGENLPSVPEPEKKFENSEIAARLTGSVSSFSTALYFYKGFYKNPVGFDPNMGEMGSPVYPKLNVYGGSLRGQIVGGILWLEGGYFDSRQDSDGDNPYIPNSAIKGLVGFERQVANNLTANLQWQADYMTDYDIYKTQMAGAEFIRDEVYHLLTTRWTKLLNSELITLSFFGFYSPTDEDAYIRLSASYKYTDQVNITVGGNIFDGKHKSTDFGQFMLNDNVYLKLTYGF
ncbi:MAG: DUF1302 family protein [bacterium]